MHEILAVALSEFLAESRESLDRLELEPGPSLPPGRARLDAMFRAVHTIKGSSGFLELPRLESLAHAGEGLIVRLLDGSLPWRPEVAEGLLLLVAGLRAALRRIESGAGEADGDGLADALDRLSSDPGAVEAAPGTRHEADPAGGGHLAAVARRLDCLAGLAGGLAIGEVARPGRSPGADAEVRAAEARFDRVSAALSESIGGGRPQPIGLAWAAAPDMVRVLAAACGKQARLVAEGSQAEFDPAVVGALRAAMVHLIRNAIDHGIEPPERRAAGGKPAAGRVRLAARLEDGRAVVEVEDDGAGVDLGRVAERAVAAGLIDPGRDGPPSPSTLGRLLFLPGFSTAERVTRVSGRGVGLDAVRVQVERVGGAVELESRHGLGTTVRMILPHATRPDLTRPDPTGASPP